MCHDAEEHLFGVALHITLIVSRPDRLFPFAYLHMISPTQIQKRETNSVQYLILRYSFTNLFYRSLCKHGHQQF